MNETFHFFPKLPRELRCKIWSFSFSPRAVQLHTSSTNDDQDRWMSSCRNHAELSVNSEARSEATRHCPRSIPIIGGKGARLYVDPISDTLVILGRYNPIQLTALFDIVRPRLIGLNVAYLAPPFVRKTLPGWRKRFSPALQQLAVLPNELPAVGFRGECTLEQDHLYALADYLVNGSEVAGMHIVRLKFISNNTFENEVSPPARADGSLEICLRFGERSKICQVRDLKQFFEYLKSLSTMLEKALPLLEIYFTTKEPHSPHPDTLQIFSRALTAGQMKEALDLWDAQNSDLRFEYIANNSGFVIRARKASNITIRNVTTTGRVSMHFFGGRYGLEMIELLHAQARQAMGPSRGATFLLCASESPLNVVGTLLRRVDDHTDAGESSIIEAINYEDEMLAIRLVERGADPNLQDDGGSALTQAIRAGYERLAIRLVERGADPNSQDRDGPALTQAIRAGYERLAVKLVERGADPHSGDDHGLALMQAISVGYRRLAATLVEKMC